jgi:coenzyme PQQ precursor peptide PqqA
MKIMRPESWSRDWLAHPLRETMRCGMQLRVPAQVDRPACHSLRRPSMQWTTPTACDLRFGFEITMYVSAR